MSSEFCFQSEWHGMIKEDLFFLNAHLSFMWGGETIQFWPFRRLVNFCTHLVDLSSDILHPAGCLPLDFGLGSSSVLRHSVHSCSFLHTDLLVHGLFSRGLVRAG